MQPEDKVRNQALPGTGNFIHDPTLRKGTGAWLELRTEAVKLQASPQQAERSLLFGLWLAPGGGPCGGRKQGTLPVTSEAGPFNSKWRNRIFWLKVLRVSQRQIYWSDGIRLCHFPAVLTLALLIRFSAGGSLHAHHARALYSVGEATLALALWRQRSTCHVTSSVVLA